MTRFPHASGVRGKKRPAVVIQADSYNAKVGHVLVAEVTRNLKFANDPAFVLIDLATTDGKATGLDTNSLVSSLFLATVFEDRIDRVVGKLSGELMAKVDACLKVALALH